MTDRANAKDGYQSIFDAANDAILVHDMANGAILDVNRKTCQMYGYTADEVCGLTIEDLSSGEPPCTQQDALDWVRKAIDGTPQIFEWRARTKSGRLFWVEVNLKRAVVGGVGRLLAIVRDIDARKQVEDELHRSHQALDALFRSAHSGICLYDFQPPDKLILADANPAAEAATGIKLHDWKGREFDEIWPEAREMGITDLCLEVARTGGDHESEDFVYKDERINAAFRVHTFTLPNSRLAVASENITKRMSAEEDAARCRSQLEVSARQHSEMLAGLDSELRSALGRIVDLTQAAGAPEPGSPPASAVERFKEIENSARSLLALLDAIPRLLSSEPE